LRQGLRWPAGLPEIGIDGHCVRDVDEAGTGGADRGGGNGLGRKSEEDAAAGSMHRGLLLVPFS
jgi:hypothetical protein